MASAETRPPQEALLVRLGADAPFAAAARDRASGPIGGFVPVAGLADHLVAARLAALARSLGPAAALLPSQGCAAVFEADACSLDNRPLEGGAWESLRLPDDLGRLDGAFTVAWKEADGTVGFARDPIGERTLFYAATPEGVVFASTLAAVLAIDMPRRLHLPSVAAYLSYAYLPGRRTLIDGVFKVLPGEVVRVRGGRIERSTYWSLPPEPDADPPNEEVLRRRLRGALERAVTRRLSPGRMGAFLSGGIDSSLVVALARRLHGGTLETWSVSFGPSYPNELAFSSMVASHCETEHHVVEVSADAVVAHLDETMALLGDPIGDPLTVPNALLFREAAAETSAVLNGEGGDPCFGGPKNVPMILAELFDDGDGLARERAYLRAHQKCYDDLPAMLTADVQEALAAEPLENELSGHLNDQRWPRFVTRLMAVNVALKGAQHILQKVDALSAPFGVVPRSPLFDRAVVEMAFEIPPQMKLKGTVEKYLLKRAVEDLLPRPILERPKSGMLVPVQGWFRGELLPEARHRLLDGLTPYGIIRRDWMERLLDGRLHGPRPRRGAKIWLLVALESWLRAAIPLSTDR